MTADLRAISNGPNEDASDVEELHLLVIDPRSLTRDCLVAALENVPNLGSVIAVGSAEEAAAILARINGPTAALLNLASDAFDHPTLSRMIDPLRQAAPGSILVLTAHVDAEHARAALRLGVAGFLSTETSFDLTVDAIRFVSRGWVTYPRSVLEQPVVESVMLSSNIRRMRDEMLTGRQRQVLEGLSRGMTNRQIAASLMVTERTVKAHVKELMRRLGASNRTQVVAIASAYP
ncbi:response regulator transcription factor [Sphingomonas sp.]|uniref:response regulator transcription factor n=1 Tax=Sphingomonas sp. TaxID=28214 RepID=UPI0031DE9D45